MWTLGFQGKASSLEVSRGAYFKGTACSLFHAVSSAFSYCWVLADIFGNSDASGQKACLFTTLCGFKGLTSGNLKKQLLAKTDLWMIKWSYSKLRVLCSVVREDSIWSWKSENLTAFTKGGTLGAAFQNARRHPTLWLVHSLAILYSLPTPPPISSLLCLWFSGTLCSHLMLYCIIVLCSQVHLSGLWEGTGVVWCLINLHMHRTSSVVGPQCVFVTWVK